MLLLSLVSASWCSSAHAQGPTATQPDTNSAQPLDVVLLKNGGMLRGTIAELVPEQYVVITTTAGDQRRIEMKDVTYAGPAKDAPSAAPTTKSDAPSAPAEPPLPALPPLVPPALAGKFAVHFAGEPGVRFHVRTGQAVLRDTRLMADSFTEVCTAPCNAMLERQSYTFALSKDDGRPLTVKNAINLDGPATLSGKYTSYTGLRVAGWITLIGGLVVGTTMMSSASNDCDPSDDSCEPFDQGLLWGGVAVAAVGTVLGLIMVFKKDEADVRVAPAQQVRLRRPAIAVRRERARSGFMMPVFSARF